MNLSPATRYLLRFLALGYLLVLLVVPVGLILWRTFAPGVGEFVESITTPAAISALQLSLLVVAIVVPLNVVFGVPTALVLARNKFRGKSMLQAVIDLPFAVSPVVVGVALILLWGSAGVFGFVENDFGLKIIFGFPGIVLASIFVTIPYVIREVEPVLHELGTDQEEAASTLGSVTWQTFWRITLPSIKWGLMYGVVLTVARTLGEYGAVIMVSSNLPGISQTLTLLVSDRHNRGAEYGAYAISTLLMAVAVVVLIAQVILDARRREDRQVGTRRRDMTNAITVRAANKHYGDFAALDNVDFDVPSGSLTALLGPSGSGKSTLLRAIAGLDQPDTGTITINGHDVTGVPPQRRGIGFVFQHYAAFKHLTVRDNVGFGLKIRKKSKAEITEKVDNLLEVVGLAGFQGRYPNQLSGGQRQRMALARALAVDPQVLLLDEPFGALDAKVREDLRAWLRRLHDEVHVTTVLVTHDQAEALDVADRIAVLNKGRIEQVGSPTEVYDAPANAFVMSFLGAVSSLNGSLVRPHDIRVGRNPDMAIASSDDSVQATGVLRATIDRIVMLGFEVRVELTSAADQTPFTAQITRGDAEALGLKEGDTVYVRATRVPPLPGGAEIPKADDADEDEALTKA